MIAHAMVHTYELSIPILMTVWLTEFGTSMATLGTLVAVGYALFGLGALPSGILTDRFGARRLIAIGLAGMGIAFLLLSFARSLVLLTAALALWGVAASVYHPAGLALISKGVRQRGQAFAFHGMAGNAGIAVGPLATTLLLLAFDWRTVSVLLAVPALGALAVALYVRFDEAAAVPAEAMTAAATPSFSSLLHSTRRLLSGPFVAVLAVVMLSGLYYRGVLTFLPEMLSDYAQLTDLQLGDVDLQAGRYIYAALLVIGMLGQYVGGRLTDRMLPERALTGALAVLAGIALLFIVVAQVGLLPLLAISALLGFFLFVVQPLYQAMVAEHTPADMRGLSYGYTYLGVFGVGALGAAIAGIVLDYSGRMAMFGVLAGFAAAAALLSLFLVRRHMRQPTESP